MSYILEALRRADAERSQATGAAHPDLTARSPGIGRVAPRRFRETHGLGLGLVALALASAGWWVFSGTTAEAPPPPSPPAVAGAIDTPSDPGHTPASAPQALDTPPPPADRWNAPVTAATPPILSPEPKLPVRPRDAVARGGSAPPASVAHAPAASATPTPLAASTPAPTSGLKVTGSTHSDNPAHRMLIINGRVVLEGQEVEPGLTLEVITPHSAILNRQGNRFNINY